MQEPYEYCGRMREEDPLHWNELYELWLITRYDDLVWLTRHPELFSVGLLAARPAGAVSVRQ
jgi:cytochrome P450